MSRAATSYDQDIVICGAGPTGLVLAMGLADKDLKIMILNKHTSRGPWARATNIWPRNIESIFLFSRQLHDTFTSKTAHVSHWALAFGDYCYLHIPLWNVFRSKVAPLIWFLPQSETEQIFEDYIRARVDAPIDFRIGWTLDQFTSMTEGIEVIIREGATGTIQKVRCRYLIGCDGTKSTVRSMAKIPFDIWPREFASWVADGSFSAQRRGPGPELLNPPMSKKVLFLLTRDRMAGFFPLKSGHVRVALSVPLEYNPEGQLIQPTEEQFNRRLAAFPTHYIFKVSNLASLSCTRFWFGICRTYSDVTGRILVAGDAAHVHSPVGGQGMNLGMQDAFNLSWKLRMCIKHSNIVNVVMLLRSYELERRPVGEAIVNRTYMGTIAAFSGHSRLVWWLYTLIARLTYKIALTHSVRLFSQLSYNYAGSPLCEDDWPRRKWYCLWDHSGVAAGYHIPFTSVVEASGEQEYLAALCSNQGFTLLVFPPLDPKVSTSADQEWLILESEFVSYRARPLVTKVIFVQNGQPSSSWSQRFQSEYKSILSVQVVQDVDSRVQFVGNFKDSCIYVIRPDGFIGFRSRPFKFQSLTAWFSKFVV